MFCLLKVIDGPASGVQLRLMENQRLVIGRLSTADLSIAGDQHLSRNHLVIEGEGGGFRVRDEGSRNGTFVNNVMIRSTILCSGDIIRAGKSLFQVQLRHESPQQEPTSSAIEEVSGLVTGVPYRTLESSASAMNSRLDQGEIGLPARDSINDEATMFTPPVQDLSLLNLLLNEFSLDSTSQWIWKQNSECDLERSCSLLESIQGLGVHLNFVINQSQIDLSRFAGRDQFREFFSAIQLSQTLWMVRSRNSEALKKISMNCWGRDGSVIVGTRDDFQTRWLEDALDVLSYPSLLKKVVCTSESRANQLSKGIQFLLFESDSDNRLRLMLGKELQEKFALLEHGAIRNQSVD